MKAGNCVINLSEYIRLKKIEDGVKDKMLIWRVTAYKDELSFVFLDPIDEFKKIKEALNKAELNEKRERDLSAALSSELNFYRSSSAIRLFLFKLMRKEFKNKKEL